MTLFKATNQRIGLHSAILSLCHLTVNGIKKCYFSLGADLLKGFHLLSRYLISECLKKNAQFVQVRISTCTVCLIANLGEHA